MSTLDIKKDLVIDYTIRTMSQRDLPQVLSIQKETGWQMGTQSIFTWFKADPKGWKVAVTLTGEILGLCGAVRQCEDFHFVGFYVVREKYRNKGIGTQIWNACLDYIGQRNAGLNAVPEMTDKYKKNSGFPFVDEDCLLAEYETYEEILVTNISSQLPDGVAILPFEETHLTALLAYDQELGGYSRQHMMELSCKEKNTLTLVAFKNNACVGFATLKTSMLNVPHLGPMYADDETVAEAMLKQLLLDFPIKKGFSAVTFKTNKTAQKLMKKIGCPPVCLLSRMYIKKELQKDFKRSIDKIYAVYDIYIASF